MENSINIQKKKGFFQRMAELFFMIYMITLYIFVDRGDTLIISQLAFIAFTGLTIIVILQKQRIHLGKNVMVVYFAFAWMFASYFWAKNEYVAWMSAKTIWKLFLLLFLTYNLFAEEENAHEFLIKSLYVAGVSLLIYSVYIYGLGEVIDMMTGNRELRLGSEINQENSFGMMNATTCMVTFYYLLYRKRFKLFHIVVLALAFLFAMSSGSKKALFAICIGVLFLVYKKYGIRKVYKIVAIVAILSLVFVSVMQLPVFETINHRMEQMMEQFSGKNSGDGSTGVRMRMIDRGWELYKERLLTGFGANNYRIVTGFRTYAHNNFIEVLVDFGLIGFFLYYLIYWQVLKNLWNMKSDAGKALLCVFLTRLMMEIAMVSYFDKIHWIMFAFFMIDSTKSQTESALEKNEGISD